MGGTQLPVRFFRVFLRSLVATIWHQAGHDLGTGRHPPYVCGGGGLPSSRLSNLLDSGYAEVRKGLRYERRANF